MKRFSEKAIAAALFAAMLLGGCAAQKDAEQPSETSGTSQAASEADTTTALSDELPELHYDGAPCRVMIYDSSEQNYDMMTEGKETGDILNDAVYQRNAAVSERLGISFEIIGANDTEKINSSIMSESDDFDLLFWPICYSISIANKNGFLSTSDMPYVNLDKPWWDASLRRDLSINNSLVFLTGDISPAGLNMSSCLLFNKDLFDQHNLTYPYDAVTGGSWTMDAFSEILKDRTSDLNGDGKIRPNADLYGLSCWMYDVPYSLFYGAGGKMVEKDSDDIPHIREDLDQTVSIMEKVYDIIIDKQSFFAVNTGEAYEQSYTVFSENRAFFIDTKLFGMSKLRDMSADFGVLPLPKYDENQENYTTFVNSASNMISVPVTAKDPEKTSAILEAMAFQSYKTLTPKFKESVLKGKMARDQESWDMMDIIIRNRVFDIAYIYNIEGYMDFQRTLLMEKSKNVVSHLESYKQKAENSLASIVEIYTK